MDSSNNLDFAGSQFLPNASFNASDGNIDPALLAITPSTSKYLSTNFDQDVDESAQGTVPGAQVRPNGRSPRSHLGAHSLNPRAPPFAPAPQIIPQQPNWQIGNPFAPLENHYEPAIRQLNQQIPSTSELFQNSSYPQQHIVHPDQHHDLGNVLPPYLAGEARISPPMVDAWTQQVYNPAAAIPPFSQAQPTPNPSARQSRRGSLAPSTSTAQSMICCGKRFEKMHQFKLVLCTKQTCFLLLRCHAVTIPDGMAIKTTAAPSAMLSLWSAKT